MQAQVVLVRVGAVEVRACSRDDLKGEPLLDVGAHFVSGAVAEGRGLVVSPVQVVAL